MTEAANAILVVVRGMEVLVEHDNGSIRLCPREKSLQFAGAPILVGHDGEQTWYAAPALLDVALPEGLAFSPVRALFTELPEATLHFLGRALACVEFEETHRYCGRCATPTTSGPVAVASPADPSERVRVCPQCGLTFHPRIPPAVIVLVERGDRVLFGPRREFSRGPLQRRSWLRRDRRVARGCRAA